LMKDMEILIDTNIVLDWILEREPFLQNAKNVMEPCIRGEMQGYLTAHTILNIFYIARKWKSIEDRKEILLMLCQKFNIIGIDRQTIIDSLQNKKWDDLEDGLQMHCAFTESLDYIITRDPKGFVHSRVKTFSPTAFLEHVKDNTP